MRILVTGGSGFVGGHVARQLSADGHELRLLMRPTSDDANVRDIRFERAIGDLMDADSLASACEGVDTVVHSAAVLRAANADDFMRVNREGTEHLVSAAADAGVRRFLHISSIAAQGPAPSSVPEPPETVPHPVSAYGRSKAASEEAVLERRGDMQVTFLRPPIVYGPADAGLLPFFRMARRRLSARLGDGTNLLDVIYGPDLAEAVSALLQADLAEVAYYHICDEAGPYTWNELLGALEATAGKRLLILALPAGVFHGAARLSEWWALLTHSAPTLDRMRVIEMRQPAWICDASSLTRDTGWQARHDLLGGMQATMSWYRQHGWV